MPDIEYIKVLKLIAQLCDWFRTNSTLIASTCPPPNTIARAHSMVHSIQLILDNVFTQLCVFVAHLSHFLTHWIAIGCHLLRSGFVNPIPETNRREKGSDKRIEDGCGFGDAELAPDASDVSGQVESLEQIEGLKAS